MKNRHRHHWVLDISKDGRIFARCEIHSMTAIGPMISCSCPPLSKAQIEYRLNRRYPKHEVNHETD